jgi:predicted ATPase
MSQISSLQLSGWRSIRNETIDFGPVNVLIGANGAGKSNLLSFFKLVDELAAGRLDPFVASSGGADSLLFFGSKVTASITAEFHYSNSALDVHLLRLIPVPVNRLSWTRMSSEQNGTVTDSMMTSSRTFHFHDTSALGPLRRDCLIDSNRYLQSDGENLPAMLYLYKQKHSVAYHRIVAATRSIAPFFDDFLLEPLRLTENRISLRWKAIGREYEFGPHQLSDGTLRSIALFTLLLGPDEDRPNLIVLDEPELGLHPAAITIFSDLVKEVSMKTQVILATQSTALVDHFEPEDIVAVNSRNGESTFERLDRERLKSWLEDYSIGELWERNVVGGGPY